MSSETFAALTAEVANPSTEEVLAALMTLFTAIAAEESTVVLVSRATGEVGQVTKDMGEQAIKALTLLAERAGMRFERRNGGDA